MANSTRWENEYDASILESVAAKAKVALEPSPRMWLASGDGVTEWNPGGNTMLPKRPPRRWVDNELKDERTPELNK